MRKEKSKNKTTGSLNMVNLTLDERDVKRRTRNTISSDVDISMFVL